MIFPRLERLPDGVAFEELAPAFILILLEVPELLGPDQPDEVKQRLFPDPGDDEQIRKDWAKYVHPELYALLASAREIVVKDLGNVAPSRSDRAFGSWRLEIPAAHINGWISALNAARLALGAVAGIENEEDLHPELDEDFDEATATATAPESLDERQITIAKIHLLGELQAMLLFDQTGENETSEDETEDGTGENGTGEDGTGEESEP